eukprot:7988675-Pyramimonas_sp.AAC.1
MCVPIRRRVRHADRAAGAFGRAPFGTTKRVSGVPRRVRVRHADPAASVLVRAPFGTTKLR